MKESTHLLKPDKKSLNNEFMTIKINKDLDFSDIEEKYKVPFEEGFDPIIVVDNAPTADESKKDKLLKFIRKIFKNAGNVNCLSSFVICKLVIHYKSIILTLRILFIEFETPEQAAMAIKQYDGYPMYKTHHLAVNRFTDIEKYSQIEEEYKEPEEEKFVKKTEPPEEVHERINWTETCVQWSPLGTYLATFHRQGIALWGVKLIDFSLNEKYLVTWSIEPITLGPNVGAGTPFGPEDERLTQGQQGQQGQQVLSVYETPNMRLVGNKSIKIEGLVNFEWAPASDQEKKQREELLIHWQSNGDFLCVKVDRHTKTKESTFSNLEIFRVREKDIPVGGVTLKTSVSFYYLETDKGDSVGTVNFKLIKILEKKKTSNAVYWSPQGRHVVLATLLSATTFDLEFWDLDFETTLDQKESAKADPAACLQLMITQEHYDVTDVEWDPAGRYVITSSSFWRHEAMKKNLREYSKLFDKEDEYAKLRLSKGQIELQRHLMEE
ncbi:eukaryotic translation initiation factor eIF2A-domain-containing protein [Gigaspora rosea]|uniref:Eukaryotic translation initiation factor eIF2A-domain-containing protein n=1 Tax=Gigaspora rosea TaxID=44941 RepID=A0A397UQ19_9GLOM|nr:eukaryotic translation initiation factor eIF2A-domain-containing protein [Gigaspora rosea]